MKKWQKIVLFIFFSTLSGIGIGWLIGMSTSPLLQGIITSLMTLMVATLTVVANVTNDGNTNASAFFDKISLHQLAGLSTFIIAFAASASLGIYVRSNEMLGLNPEKFAEKWQSKNHSKDEIKERLFEKIYSKDSLSEEKQKQLGNALYAVTVSECADLRSSTTKEDLLAKLITLQPHDERITKFLSVTQDSAAIFAFRDLLCP